MERSTLHQVICKGKNFEEIFHSPYLIIFFQYREISDLLYASGGRIELADIAQSLVIDYSHIETQV